MAVTVTCTQIFRQAGRVYARWSDGTELEFRSAAAARDWVMGLDDDPALARRLLLALWLRANPSGDTPSLVEGRSLTIDLAATPIVQVSQGGG